MLGLGTLSVLGRRWWPLLAVLAFYAASAVVVPTLAPVAVGDDWVYARSVEILVHEHRLQILDLSVATLVFQVAWGALFAGLFGMTFGALRLSTVALVFLSGGALYGLCRELGVSRGRSALGAAAYLFNPLAYVLGFTFMTDPHFAALLVVATACYARGLRPGAAGRRATLAGSAVAALAFLVRQQGALIPLAVALSLLAGRRLRPDRDGVALLLRVVAIPAATAVLYSLWLAYVHGVPLQQRSFLDAAREAGWSGTWQLVRWLTFIAAMYLGFFALPIVAAALVRVPRLVRSTPPPGWVLVCAWEAVLVAGLATSAQRPGSPRMPYIPQYLNPWQLGLPDILGGRPWLFADRRILDWVTGLCAGGSLLLALALARQIGAAPTPERAAAGLTLMVGIWQGVGVLPPSYHFRTWTISMDRYLLPLLPFAVCLGLWAMRDVRLPLPAAWMVVAAFAAFAVAGTRDHLVFQEATWELARHANRLGVENARLDAGPAWDGYHLWKSSHANDVAPRTPNGPWWVYLFAPATDSSYVVATAPQGGYDVVAEVEYSAWLLREPASLYLLRRQGVPPPP